MVFEVIIFITPYYFYKRTRSRWLISMLCMFCLLGSIRQSNFRATIWELASQEERENYLRQLDQYSPLHFALFLEPATKP